MHPPNRNLWRCGFSTVSALFRPCNSPLPCPSGEAEGLPARFDAVSEQRALSPDEPYPGSRLGVPADGPGSVASWGRRLLALVVDWAACLLVAGAIFGRAVWGQGWQAWTPMGVFLVEASVLTALAGGSFGQLALRLAVVRLDNKPLNLLQTFARTALICLVFPPLVFNRDNRGLHDLAVNTVTLRR